MICLVRPIRVIRKMLSGYQEWVEKKGGRMDGQGKGKHPARPMRVSTVQTREPAPSGGVMSYNQMRRLSSSGARPPSEVGSIRSFRSVQTVEEQVNQLEEKVQDLAATQQEMDAKLNQILTILTKTEPKKAGP